MDEESISLGSSIILQSVRSSSAKECKPDNGGIRKWKESGLLLGNKLDQKSEFHESEKRTIEEGGCLIAVPSAFCSTEDSKFPRFY